MRKKIIAVLFILSLFPFLVNGAHAAAGDPVGADDPSMQDDDLQIGEEIKKEEKAKRIVKKEDLPPINMVMVKGGCYQMGDSSGNGDDDERPQHEVCLNDFYLMETEVTQELFEAVMGYIPAWRYNPSMPRDPKAPVTYVSFSAMTDFIKKLNEITKGYYRLPTEAEWEYAARSGGKNELWPGLNNEGELGNYAWFSDNGEDKLQPVKAKKPNALGLYDMAGNVWEWTEDYFDFEYYQISPKENPYGAEFSFFRVVRGGSIADGPYKLRTTYRYGLEPTRRMMHVGFRLAE